MPVVQANIKTQVDALIASVNASNDPDAFANGLATIITSAILSATVTLPPGSVVTVGSAATQTNAAPAIGSLS